MIPLLDNIRSVYNVGSILRTCEGFGIKEIILSGITPTPNHPRMNKTGLGTGHMINWQTVNNGVEKVKELILDGYQIISMENSSSAIPLTKLREFNIENKLCLVFGNENLGIDPDIQEISDFIVKIPMCGEKESFNVSVAFGIAAFYFSTTI